MVKEKIIFLILSLAQYSLNGQQLNCSAFIIDDENILLAKNFDYELGNGLIIFNPKGIIKKSIYDDAKTWKSNFNSITFNHFGMNQPLGGINDAGLTIEELSTWPILYPDKSDMKLTEFEWIQFQLDNYSTIKEVILNISNTAISKFYFGLHYIVADATGDKAVLEFINGETKVFKDKSLPIPSLTNNNYSELISYIMSVPDSHYLKINTANSQDRFLKINLLLKNNFIDNTEKYLFAMDILDSIKVYDTQWSIVYDVTNKNIFYKTQWNDEIKVLSFSKICYPLDTLSYQYINLRTGNKFQKLTTSINIEYLNELEMYILNQQKNDNSDLVNKINLYLK